MAQSFSLYPPDILPTGFRYPEMLLELAGKQSFDLFYPWWFVDGSSHVGIQLSRHIEAKSLVPFAKTDLYDDIACFDGNDQTGNPKICMLTSTPEREYGFSSFSSWLEKAIHEAKNENR